MLLSPLRRLGLLQDLGHGFHRIDLDAEKLGRLVDDLVDLLQNRIDAQHLESKQLLGLGTELFVIGFWHVGIEDMGQEVGKIHGADVLEMFLVAPLIGTGIVMVFDR